SARGDQAPLLKGAVRSQTAKRVYLDHGSSAGLAPGLEVSLGDQRRTWGTCVVDAVNRLQASCTLKEDLPRPVTRFRVRTAPPPTTTTEAVEPIVAQRRK